MRVLHLTPELPRWPEGSGGSTRQFHLLRRLVELGNEVTVVAPVPEHAPSCEALADAGIRLKPTWRPPSRLREGLAAVAREPSLVARSVTLPVLAWQVAVFWNRLRPIARRTAAERKPDVITVEHDHAASWGPDAAHSAPTVLTLHNLSWRYYESRARAASGLAGPALRVEARRFHAYDRRWLPRYDALVAVSERDRLDLAGMTDAPVEVVPNGVATDHFRSSGPPFDSRTLLFPGTLNHPPNVEGIRWFADQVWPRIRAARPDTTLLVVGRDPIGSVLRLDGRPGIEVLGPVQDMSPHLANSAAVVVPLRSGGGTRLKVLEAFAAGTPVVSTTVGCEGLDVGSGTQLLVADTPEDFAAASLRLLADVDLRERLARTGRKTAERLYDWRVLGEGLAGILERVSSR